jgi:hypothetical protein
MSKKAIYDVFNSISGVWEEQIIEEGEFIRNLSELDNEKDVLDAELEVINRIIEQHLNQPIEGIKLRESKD